MTDKTKPTEIELLKEQANIMGVEYPNNISVARLKKLIAEKLNTESNDDNSNETRKELEDENFKLVNVIITPMDSSKVNYSSQYFAVGNSVLGTIARVIPFGKPWLVENMLVKHIQSLQFQQIVSRKDGKNDNLLSNIIPAYNVQILPLPTKEEIEELAKTQTAKASLD